MAWLVGALEAQGTQYFVWKVMHPAFLVEVGILQQDLVIGCPGLQGKAADAICFAVL